MPTVRHDLLHNDKTSSVARANGEKLHFVTLKCITPTARRFVQFMYIKHEKRRKRPKTPYSEQICYQ